MRSGTLHLMSSYSEIVIRVKRINSLKGDDLIRVIIRL